MFSWQQIVLYRCRSLHTIHPLVLPDIYHEPKTVKQKEKILRYLNYRPYASKQTPYGHLFFNKSLFPHVHAATILRYFKHDSNCAVSAQEVNE